MSGFRTVSLRYLSVREIIPLASGRDRVHHHLRPACGWLHGGGIDVNVRQPAKAKDLVPLTIRIVTLGKALVPKGTLTKNEIVDELNIALQATINPDVAAEINDLIRQVTNW
jgi:hypothetical protein